ncbi:hypothetical protein HZS_2608 [Henneguya salminicola]|nr:hypothetical protein HZS_2608 [Henneguya salminicola]
MEIDDQTEINNYSKISLLFKILDDTEIPVQKASKYFTLFCETLTELELPKTHAQKIVIQKSIYIISSYLEKFPNFLNYFKYEFLKVSKILLDCQLNYKKT